MTKLFVWHRPQSKRAVVGLVYGVVTGLLCLAMVLGSWIDHLVHLDPHRNIFDPPDWHSAGFNYFYLTGESNSSSYFSKFSIQSNLICICILLFGYGLNPKNSFNTLLMTGALGYITIAAVTFDAVLLPLLLHDIRAGTRADCSQFDWAATYFKHMLLPVFFFIYVLFLRPTTSKVDIKRFFKRRVWWLFVYPTTYFVLMLLRGELILSYLKRTDKTLHWINLQGKSNRSEIFNYFFLNWHDKTHGLPGAA